MRYRTIVADPPWEYPEGFALGPGHGVLEVRPLPYPALTFDAICDLPVERWRFKYRQTLVWHKRDANLPASVAPNSVDFVLVGTRGAPKRLKALPSSLVSTTRSGGHSAKPDVWLDYFETVSRVGHLGRRGTRTRFACGRTRGRRERETR